jgi:formylglycine-generating enzyme required for sulfatase activity
VTAADDQQTTRRMLAVLDAETDSIDQLARLAGLDPATALRGADLRGLTFDEGDNLAGFRLRNADLRGADLRRAQGVSAEVLAGAVVDAATLLPGRKRPFPPRDPLLRWREPIPALPEAAWPDMITLPAGAFLMGAPENEEGSIDDERPQHRVTIPRPFALGRTAVTFAMWDAAVASGFMPPDGAERPDDAGWGREERPVINVSWHDAQAYCAWLNRRLGLPPGTYRLPREAEWEYACRAGTVTPFSFGDTISPEQANYDGRFSYGKFWEEGEYRGHTVPVGTLPANPWGLCEMHGNVWEWVRDAYGRYPKARTDSRPKIPADIPTRVLRGGAWKLSPRDLRSATRAADKPVVRAPAFGFRVARTPG